MKKIVAAAVCLFLISSAVRAQKPDAESILRNVKSVFDRVQDYTATLTANVNMERLRIPKMKLKIYFKQPNKMHIESNNFAMLPKEGFAINPNDLLTKFDASIVGTEERNGVPHYKLRLIAKPEKGKPARETYLWIDASRWVITHLESTPAENRSVFVDFNHALIDEKYLLISSMKATFDLGQNPDSLSDKMYSPNRVPRKGTVEITYSDYEVNKGLSDEIFEKKEKGKEKK